jgi:hypothetical protein
MDHRSPSFEANLLYKTAPAPDFFTLEDELRALAEINGEELLQFEQIDSVFTLATCRRVQILLALNWDALPAEHFLGAGRPSAAMQSELEVLDRLTECPGSATVLVLDRDPDSPESAPAPVELKRSLCWDVSEAVFNATDPQLVFWSDTDILYTEAEFDRVCSYSARQELKGPVQSEAEETASASDRVPEHFRSAPELTPAAIDWIEDQTPNAAEEPAEEPQSDPAPAETGPVAMPTRIAARLSRLHGGLFRRKAMNGASMACTTATVSMTGLTNIFGLWH